MRGAVERLRVWAPLRTAKTAPAPAFTLAATYLLLTVSGGLRVGRRA